MAKAKAKGKGTVELGPDSDPNILCKNYAKECKDINVAPFVPLLKDLTNEENTSRGKQIIIVPSGDGTVLGAGGCRALVNAVAGNDAPFTAVKEMRICRSNVRDGGAAALGALLSATASKAASTPWTLQYLELTDNAIGHVGAAALGRSLCVGMNRTLATLILDFNRFGLAGVQHVCKGLSTNSTLKKLSLKYCNIDERGGTPIGEMLSFRRSGLISLDITSNSIGGTGLKDICAGLRANTALKTFRLGDNSLGRTPEDGDALEAFARVLVAHPALLGVDLLHNDIGTAGGTRLLPAVRENARLSEFKVDANMDDALFAALFRASAPKKGKGKKKGKKKKK